ncbi:unnamed protein product [Leptidea sinapis]|uniref:Uncharacterized protein n=1 Tax=Leptidea sinapis TaxID=189913 RepID=A0A5E4PV32_9NEOP|nr:unnamed protein product [Leptidea sinapis]
MIVLTFLIPDLSVRREDIGQAEAACLSAADELCTLHRSYGVESLETAEFHSARGSLSCHSAPAKLQARSVTPLRTDERIPTANFSSHLDTHQEDFI